MCRQYNMTMVLVTHDQEIAAYADRIITLIDGEVVSDVKNHSVADPMQPIEEFHEELILGGEDEAPKTTQAAEEAAGGETV